MKSKRVRSGLILTGLLVVVMGRAAIVQPSIRLRTQDTNRDGRPDVWQYYDSRGVLLRVDIDTNFDGRFDVEESYRDGHLVRRESDRNFDDRVDLIDDFDATTAAPTRAVVDADFDGRADLIVLLIDGKPVFSQWTSAGATTRVAGSAAPLADRGPDDSLRPLDDPFSSAPRMRSDPTGAAASAGCADPRWTLTGVPVLTAAPYNLSLRAPTFASFRSSPIHSSTTRGPPVLPVLV